MSRNFIRFKSKARRACLIKSILAGLSLGMPVGAAALLLSKYRVWALQDLIALPIGIAVFALIFAFTFLICRVSDKKIARALDGRFGLNERVQTMLAYGKEDSAILRLQREDTEKALENIPLKKFRLGFIWVYALTAIIGAALLAAAIVITPVEEAPPVMPEVPFQITEMQLSALEELVERVGASEMEEPYRAGVVQSLAVLVEELREADTENDRDEALQKAFDEINTSVDQSSTAVELINALGASSSNNVKAFANALKFYEWRRGSEWDEFYVKISGFRNGFRHVDEESGASEEAVMLTFVKTLISTTGTEISLALKRSGVDSSDALYQAILQYVKVDREDGAKGLSVIFDSSEGLGYYEIQNELDEMFGALDAEIFEVLTQHKTNTDTGENAIRTLAALFEVALPNFKRPDPIRLSDGDNTGGLNDENGGGAGGIGVGAVYGSDDLVLDYNTDKYVEYGTLLEQYYQLMFGIVKDGDYSEEEKAQMEKYFEILYGGFEEEDKGE